ncbi:MAG: hypothetical protein IK075_10225 [Prevotella sp.]|nr:hypothetical protein [Prevotella sp.]
MKKRFFLSLIAAIVITIGASAQNNNSYSMVLTLANGTTVTIGPNELLNIAFNNGEVSFSGESIDNLVKGIEANKAYIEKLDAKTTDLEAMIYALKQQHDYEVKDLNYAIYQLDERVKKLEERIEATNAYNKMLEDKITALEEVVARLSSDGQ